MRESIRKAAPCCYPEGVRGGEWRASGGRNRAADMGRRRDVTGPFERMILILPFWK